MSGILPISPTDLRAALASARADSAHKPAAPKAPSALEKVSKEFEGIFVRQLLHAAHFGETKGDKGYAGMMVDALAQGITQGGGLGLATQIQKDLERASELQASAPKKDSDDTERQP